MEERPGQVGGLFEGHPLAGQQHEFGRTPEPALLVIDLEHPSLSHAQSQLQAPGGHAGILHQAPHLTLRQEGGVAGVEDLGDVLLEAVDHPAAVGLGFDHQGRAHPAPAGHGPHADVEGGGRVAGPPQALHGVARHRGVLGMHEGAEQVAVNRLAFGQAEDAAQSG